MKAKGLINGMFQLHTAAASLNMDGLPVLQNKLFVLTYADATGLVLNVISIISLYYIKHYAFSKACACPRCRYSRDIFKTLN